MQLCPGFMRRGVSYCLTEHLVMGQSTGDWRLGNTKSVLMVTIYKFRNGHTFNYTRRYGPLRRPSSSSYEGLWPSAEAFFSLRAKKGLIVQFWLISGNFWCSVVTFVTFSSNLNNVEEKYSTKFKKKSKKKPQKKIQQITKKIH